MSVDLIPVIYALRSKVNESLSIGEQTDIIVDALLKLERVYSEYDSLEVVKYAKQLLSDQLLKDSQDVDLKDHLQMRGFGPIRRAVISSQIPASGDADLHGFKFAQSSNKKQKTGGYSMSFNFDDFPMFETVDSMLSGLRENAADTASLEKILALDLSELVDHPQWEELLQALKSSLGIPGQHDTVVLAIYHRFVVGFKGSSQGLDALNEALAYLVDQWVPQEDRSRPDKALVRNQLALFCTVLHASATSLQVPYQKEADRAVVLIFTLLSKGTLPSPAASSSEVTTIIEALSSTTEQGDAIAALLRAIHPFTAFSYAVQTGLLSSLLSPPPSASSDAPVALRAAVLRLRTVLVLLSCFGCNTVRAIGFIESHSRIEAGASVPMYDDDRYVWQGNAASLVSGTADAKASNLLLLPVEGSNKRFMHLSHGAELMAWFGREPSTVGGNDRPSSHFVPRWIATKLAEVTAWLNELVQKDVAALQGLQLGELVRMALTTCTGLSDCPADLVVIILQACRGLHELTEQNKSTDQPGDAMLGYVSGLVALFESTPSQFDQEVRDVLLECLEDLLNGEIFASTEASGSKETKTAFLRLLSASVKHPQVVSAEHAANIVELCALVLQVLLTATPSVALDLTPEMQLFMLQTLQSALGEVVYQEVLRDRQLVRPIAVVLISHFLNAERADALSADCNARSVQALLSVFSSSSTSEVEECLSEVKSLILDVMESEYQDADTWDRAQDVEQAPSTPFAALFALLLGLASQGHISLVSGVCGESWGELIAAGGDNELTDLCAFCVQLCLHDDNALALANECVYPYIVRLLCAAQHSPVFAHELRQRCVCAGESESGGGYTPDADGADLTEIFTQHTKEFVSGGVAVAWETMIQSL